MVAFERLGIPGRDQYDVREIEMVRGVPKDPAQFLMHLAYSVF